MSATELLRDIMKNKINHLTRNERLFLEFDIFIKICDELKKKFRNENLEYFKLLKLTIEKENNMLEANFLRDIINEMVLTGEYSLEGIAYYTQTTEEIICDIVVGKNKEPSLLLARKILNLHRSVKPHVYEEIVMKIYPQLLVKDE